MLRGSKECLIVDNCISGRELLVLRDLIIGIDDLIITDRVKVFYIGKSSGTNCVDALYTRDDKYKKEMGINLVMGNYSAPKAEYALFAEKLLIELFFQHPKNINREMDRPGRPSSGLSHFVYVAARMWPAPRDSDY